ncbi:TlyA family rRNA (cytidine-2'-O)-methyltransferase [bacterium]|nr:TlyA family rRNA (cytidine-2'-O)-methyltransferase [bacterium]
MTASGDPPERRRLDVEIVRRGLASSRARAHAAIAGGGVTVDGIPAAKPGALVSDGAEIVYEADHPYVSRGALKLDHALTAFGVAPDGRVCIDLGASTGGFTQVLLARGARRVYAVDVGRDQLDAELRADPRVRSLEGMDARAIDLGGEAEPIGLVVCDLSFISLAKAIGPALRLVQAGGDVVALFKPQFEVGRKHVGKGGIVRDDAASLAARRALEAFLAEIGWSVLGWTPSPIAGGDGNREWLVHARRAV